MMRLFVRIGFLLGTVLIAALAPAGYVHAQTAQPERLVYQGFLYDDNGKPVTTLHTFRVSYWSSGNYVDADRLPNGSINTSAPHYLGWQEVHTIKPSDKGRFSIEIGTVTGLPNFGGMTSVQLTNLHLQVEVKPQADPATAFETLDRNPEDELDDRSPIRSVGFALNANRLNGRQVGTGSGSIPLLGPGGVLGTGTVPLGTNMSNFILDFDNSESTSIDLQFGSGLGEKLSFDIPQSRFNFTDDLHVQGNLTLTGLINGIDIATLSQQEGILQVSSGAGLNVNITGGSYQLNGSVTNYGGMSNLALQDDATNYVFFGSGGLTVSTIGFPTNQSAIPLAEVLTSGGSVSSVLDRRVLQSNNSESTIEQYYHAAFPNAAYQGDATSNVGQLSVSHDNISQRNFYVWSSSRPTLQDYDVLLRVALPTNFARWKDAPLTVNYRSTSNSALENKLDISVFDTNGVPVSLSGSTTNLASTTWSQVPVEMIGGTWTPGQEFLIKFKLSATAAKQIHLGSVKLQFVEHYTGP